MKRIMSPVDKSAIESLEAGEEIELSGIIYTARDQAHKRFIELIAKVEPLPVDLRGQTIFYAGPAPPRPGALIGSVGPTTSSRMDPFTPDLLAYGVKAMIGKGDRSEEVKKAIRETKSVYFVAVGGAAAYLAQFVHGVEVVAWPELGAEAVRRLKVDAMPLTVGIDSRGRSALWPDAS